MSINGILNSVNKMLSFNLVLLILAWCCFKLNTYSETQFEKND